jgi:hypothetical protein
MQKLILLLFGLFVLMPNSFAQSKITQTSEKLSFLAYYKTINQAELAIVDDDFKTALKLYKQAFTRHGRAYAFPFGASY